jgi:GntR family transcriptional regulator, transcriptional repressor for pyruvate dehydrogenase complex
MSKFKTIGSNGNGTSADEVVMQIREMIQRGDLNFGDRLPPERDLAKLLGVSRPTLRAGIHSLVALGVLQSRQGAGTFVVDAEESPSLDSSPLQMLAALHGFKSDEMFEARIGLEMTIAGLAAERATSDQIATMADEIAEMFASVERPEQYLVHDMKFHQVIASASGNRILTALMNMVATVLFENRSKTVKFALDLKNSAEQHREIYRAIREHNIEKAREAMRFHLKATQKAQAKEAERQVSAKNGSSEN